MCARQTLQLDLGDRLPGPVGVCGFTEDGRPVGLQIIAPMRAELGLSAPRTLSHGKQRPVF